MLVGDQTKRLRKYVPWEIEIALKASLPVIVVNLNGKRQMDPDLCPKVLQTELSIHIPYGIDIMQYALDNWPASHERYTSEGKSGPFYYADKTYTDLGL